MAYIGKTKVLFSTNCFGSFDTKPGTGLCSLIGNDVENNKSYGNYATALGTNTVAGSNAFEIVNMNVTDKIITLSSVVGIKEILDSETTIPYSCQLTENYDLCGNITNVDETNKTITVDIIPNSTTTTGILWIPSHPELGDGKTIIGTGALAIGNGNKASQIGSFVAGKDNIAGGKYSGVFGDGNKAGYASLVSGQYNIGNQWSLLGGYNNKIYSKYTFASGYGNTVNGESASALGIGNTADGKASVVFGSNSRATGESSFAGGANTQANGKMSLSFGCNSLADGSYSTAIGFGATATKQGAVAIGWGAQALHDWSTALGINTKTSAQRQLVCGTWNNLDTNALFMVGNGTGNYIKNTSSTFNPNEDYYTLNSDGKTYTKQNITAFESGVTYYIRQRSSAFTVKSDGSAEVKTMGETVNSVATRGYVENKVVSQSNVSQSYDPTSSQAMSGVAIDKIIDSEELTSTNVGYMVRNLLTVKQNINYNEIDPSIISNYNYQWQYNIVPSTEHFNDLYGKYVNKIKLSINHEGDIDFDNGGNWDAMIALISNTIDGCTIRIDDKYINSRIISNISNIKYNPLNFGFTLEILCEPFILNENTDISIYVYSSRTTTYDDYGDELTYQFDYSNFIVELTSTNITDITLPINTLIFNDSNNIPKLNGEWEPVTSLIESGYVFRKTSNITGNIYSDIIT